MIHITDLPFEIEIVQNEHGFNLLRHTKHLICVPTLEIAFDVMCRLRIEQIDNPANS